MTYGEILAKHGYKFVGFWDCCFFNHNCKSGGIIVADDKGQQKNLTWNDFYKLAKELKKDD